MADTGVFQSGWKAAQSGLPSIVCPYEKPAKLPSGDAYPGDWANWLSGWCLWTEAAKGDATKERAELFAAVKFALM